MKTNGKWVADLGFFRNQPFAAQTREAEAVTQGRQSNFQVGRQQGSVPAQRIALPRYPRIEADGMVRPPRQLCS